MAMAPVFVLAVVATAAAGAFVARQLAAEGYPGIENPGQPLAGASMECMTPPEAAAFLAAHGYADGRLAGRDRDGPGARRRQGLELERPRDDATGPRLRHPGSLLPDGTVIMVVDQRDRRDRGGGLLREADAMTSADVTAAARPTAPPPRRTTGMPSRRPSGRTTRTSSGGWCSSSATSTMPRTSRRTRTSRAIDRGTGSTASTSAAGSTRSPCGWRSTTCAAGGAGWRRSAGSSRGRGATRPTRTCGRPSAALEPRTRSALLLNVLDGYTQAEIGAMLGGAGGDGRELAVARAIGAAEGARPGPLEAVVVCRQAPSGGTERLPGGAHGAPQAARPRGSSDNIDHRAGDDPDDMPQFGRSPGPILAAPRQDRASRRTAVRPHRHRSGPLRSAPRRVR